MALVRRRGPGALAALFCALAGVLAGTAGADRSEPPSEYDVKAAFLYNFAKFVEWPREAQPGTGEPFVVAVVGEDPFGPSLDRAFSGKALLGHPARVVRVASAEAAPRAQIAFISSSEEPRLPQVLQGLRRPGVLTVGDMADFARRGGMIGFRVEERRVRFDINPQSASEAGLRMSSELLKLARVVKAQPGR